MLEAITEFQGEYRWLSNFWTCEVCIWGHTWTSVECAYQASKCFFPADMKKFYRLSPVEAKRLGRKVNMRPDFNDVKLGLMTAAVRAKFNQNQDLKEKLLATGNAIIIEGNQWGDTYWGVCGNTGENHLGKIIMKIREELVCTKIAG
jgi:ribA/ribD-fused uncharacterized protein